MLSLKLSQRRSHGGAALSSALGTRPTSVNLAVAALENPPVGAGVAEVAMPLDEGAVGLDHLEDVGAACCESHGCRLLVRCGNGWLVS